MLAWDEELLRDARRARLPRRPLRQPRHRPLDEDRRGRDARSRSTCSPAAARPRAYLLRDMADDTFGLMDHLGIDVGPRGRRLDGRDDRPDDGDRRSPSGSARWSRSCRRPATAGSARPPAGPGACCSPSYPRGREAYVERARQDLQGDRLARLPDRRGARRASWPARSYDRGHNPAGDRPPDARDHAPPATAPRRCATLDVPTTVIHGSRDPLVRPAGGRATAQAIPGARLRIFEGMGHDLPRAALARLRRGDRRHRRARRGDAEPRLPALGRLDDAAERSRTFTGSRPHGPEPCASTSSATAAGAGNLPIGARRPSPQTIEPAAR